MVYSPINHYLFCFCCRLLADRVTESTSEFVSGFQKWWKPNPRLREHVESKQHIENLEKWKTLTVNLNIGNTIDAASLYLMEKEKKQ